MRSQNTLQGHFPLRVFTLLTATLFSVASILPIATNAEPADTAVNVLRPFEAIYKTTALGMTLDLTRSLTRDGENYRLESSGKNFLIKMEEFADFRLTDSGIEGVRFDSKVKTLKTNNRSVEFDKELGVIKSMKRGKWSEHPLEPGVLDQFSQQQQLRLTLMHPMYHPRHCSSVSSTVQRLVISPGAVCRMKPYRRLSET